MKASQRIGELSELLKEEPQDVFLNYALALEYATAEDFAGARSQFEKVISLNAGYIAAYYQLGKLFEAQLNTTDALRYYHIGLEKAKEQKNNKAINEFGEAIFMLED